MDVLFDAPAVLPALLTPFDERGDVDPAALREHVEFLIEGGVHGIMPCGTTGETALLEPDEVIAVVDGGGRGGRAAACRSSPTSAARAPRRPRS